MQVMQKEFASMAEARAFFLKRGYVSKSQYYTEHGDAYIMEDAQKNAVAIEQSGFLKVEVFYID